MTESAEGPDAGETAAPETGRSPEEEVTYATSAARLGAVGALVVAVGVLAGWSLVLIIVGFLVMIFLHELGHYVTARLTGMKATEFFLGFGPRIWSFTRGETEYGLKALPLGAYVRIIGMNNLDEVAAGDESRTYRQQTFPRRLLVVSAGSLMHLAQAFVLALVLLVVVGTPTGTVIREQDPSDWVVRDVMPGTAADSAGLQPGDRIVAWGGEPITTFEDVSESVGDTEVGDDVTLTVERGDGRVTLETEMGDRREANLGDGSSDVDEPTPFLGVVAGSADAGQGTRTLGLVDGTWQAASDTGRGVWMSANALADFFTPSGIGNFVEAAMSGGTEDTASSGSGGDAGGSSEGGGGDAGRIVSLVGAAQIGEELTDDGMAGPITFFFLINIFVGLVNMAPLLPLDGGHAAVAIYERLRSRNGVQYRVDAAKLMPMVYAVVMVLMFLGLTALYLDIVDPVQM